MDIASYRLNERLAKAAVPSWRLMAIQGPHHFRNVGFPVEIESADELFNLLDTMHENRFARVVAELGGLDEADLALLLDALLDYCRFFRVNFPGREAPIPLSTMVAHLAIARKLRGLGMPKRILEIGPGCGYLSFFLRDWPGLSNYTQIETAQSFYIFQNLVNKHVFSHRFRDHAQGDWAAHGAARTGILTGSTDAQKQASYEAPERLPLGLPTVCHHYPWWRIDEVAEQQFDVVTSNANFNEFSEGALLQYVQLIDRCLAQEGCLLIQDMGGGALPLETIKRELAGIGLAAVVATLPSASVIGNKSFAATNYLFVRRRHPSFAKYAGTEREWPLFDPSDPLVRDVYLPRSSSGRRHLSPGDVLQALAGRLEAARR